MKNLIDFYDYCGISFALLYELYRDTIHPDFDDNEYTELGILVCDCCEFELLCDLGGCLDANL